MAYGKHNDAYPPPAPKKVERPPMPSLGRAASTVGGGGHAAPTGPSADPGHRVENANISCPPTPMGARKGDTAYPVFNAPSGPTPQPGRGFRGKR